MNLVINDRIRVVFSQHSDVLGKIINTTTETPSTNSRQSITFISDNGEMFRMQFNGMCDIFSFNEHSWKVFDEVLGIHKLTHSYTDFHQKLLDILIQS